MLCGDSIGSYYPVRLVQMLDKCCLSLFVAAAKYLKALEYSCFRFFIPLNSQDLTKTSFGALYGQKVNYI